MVYSTQTEITENRTGDVSQTEKKQRSTEAEKGVGFHMHNHHQTKYNRVLAYFTLIKQVFGHFKMKAPAVPMLLFIII